MYSIKDKEYFVIVQDEKVSEIITILTVPYYLNISGQIYGAEYELAKKLMLSKTVEVVVTPKKEPNYNYRITAVIDQETAVQRKSLNRFKFNTPPKSIAEAINNKEFVRHVETRIIKIELDEDEIYSIEILDKCNMVLNIPFIGGWK